MDLEGMNSFYHGCIVWAQVWIFTEIKIVLQSYENKMILQGGD